MAIDTDNVFEMLYNDMKQSADDIEKAARRLRKSMRGIDTIRKLEKEHESEKKTK